MHLRSRYCIWWRRNSDSLSRGVRVTTTLNHPTVAHWCRCIILLTPSHSFCASVHDSDLLEINRGLYKFYKLSASLAKYCMNVHRSGREWKLYAWQIYFIKLHINDIWLFSEIGIPQQWCVLIFIFLESIYFKSIINKIFCKINLSLSLYLLLLSNLNKYYY